MIRTQTFYTDGQYLEENPKWHADESPWKVSGILSMLKKHAMQPRTICEVGCGAGEVLRLLQNNLSGGPEFWGYDISPQAIEFCRPKANSHLHFELADATVECREQHFDLMLFMDVLEHLEDYFSFMRALQDKSEYKIIQLPMDISLYSVLFKHLPEFHKSYGHLHYFTKETALQMVHDAGYEIIDYAYNGAPNIAKLDWDPAQGKLWLLPKKLLGLARRFIRQKIYTILFRINQDFAVRLTGRQRILILAR